MSELNILFFNYNVMIYFIIERLFILIYFYIVEVCVDFVLYTFIVLRRLLIVRKVFIIIYLFLKIYLEIYYLVLIFIKLVYSIIRFYLGKVDYFFENKIVSLFVLNCKLGD